MGRLLIRLSLFVFLSQTFAFAAVAHAYEIKSLKSEFRDFVNGGQNLEFDQRLDLWKSVVEVSELRVYWHILGRNEGAQDAVRRQKAEQHFQYMFDHSQEILDNFEIFESQVPRMLQDLTGVLPAPEGREIRVLALPSFISFNGQVTTIDGVVYVMFGMDMIAKIAGDPTFIPGSHLLNDIPVLVAHEFGHAIHTYENEDGDLLDPLWKEGLAQVVSQVFVPGSAYESILMDRNLAERCTRTQVIEWAQNFLIDLDMQLTDEEQDKKVGKWFLFGGLDSLGANRAGYCLGYHGVTSLLDRYSVRELMQLERHAVARDFRSAIEKIANGR